MPDALLERKGDCTLNTLCSSDGIRTVLAIEDKPFDHSGYCVHIAFSFRLLENGTYFQGVRIARFLVFVNYRSWTYKKNGF